MKDEHIQKTLSIYLLIMGLLLLMLVYIFVRNNNVLKFRNDLLWHDWDNISVMSEEYKTYHDEIYKKYSYNQYVFSFKPLKVEYWFSEDEIRKYDLHKLGNTK